MLPSYHLFGDKDSALNEAVRLTWSNQASRIVYVVSNRGGRKIQRITSSNINERRLVLGGALFQVLAFG